MYKAIFHLAPTRAEFLSLLLSRPLPKPDVPVRNASTDELAVCCSHIAADDKHYQYKLAEFRKLIKEGFRIPLSDSDSNGLDYIYKSFRTDGLDFFFSSRRRHTRCLSDWSSDVCSSD